MVFACSTGVVCDFSRAFERLRVLRFQTLRYQTVPRVERISTKAPVCSGAPSFVSVYFSVNRSSLKNFESRTRILIQIVTPTSKMMSSNLRFGVAFYLVASVIVIGMNVNGINCEDKEVNEAKNETLTSPANETLASPANKTLIFSANETIGETDKTQIDCGPKELCDKAQIQVLTCTGE